MDLDHFPCGYIPSLDRRAVSIVSGHTHVRTSTRPHATLSRETRESSDGDDLSDL